MSPETHDPELAALATTLAALAPAAGQLDRDQLLFRAGQASVARRGWLWPSVAAFLALLAVAVSLSSLLRPAPQRVQCVIYQRVEPPASPAEHLANKQTAPPYAAASASEETESPMAPQSYLRLQRLILVLGVDALPSPPAAASSEGHGPLQDALPKILSLNDWLRM